MLVKRVQIFFSGYNNFTWNKVIGTKDVKKSVFSYGKSASDYRWEPVFE